MANPFDIALQQEGMTGPLADLARSIYMQESGGGRNTATSNAGAVGGMQIIPATFARMADQGWDINDPVQNARAGLRYVSKLHELSGGNPALTAAGYYGGEGAIPKARQGIPVSDPRNPNAPNTLQYGQQVANRLASATMSDANPPAISKNPFDALNAEFAIGAPTQTQNNNPFESLNKEFDIANIKTPELSVQVKPQNNEPKTVGDTLTSALMNVPSSAGKFAGDIYHAVTNPIETGKNLGMVLAGGMKNAMPKNVQDFITSISSEPGQIDKAVEMANAVGGEYAKNYGTVAGFKQHLASDPIAVMGDMSILLTGGGSLAAKLPGAAGRISETVANVGRAVDPINVATSAVSKSAKLAEALGSNALGLTTGAGASAIREAAKAGAVGGNKAEAFLGQMRGDAPIENVVASAKDAVAELYKNRSDAYKTNMSGITTDKTVLNFAPIDQAITNAEKIGSFHGIPIRENAAAALTEIRNKIDQFKAGNPAVFHTVEGFDKLKQSISDIQQAQPFGSPARKVADEMYNAVKNEITKQAPAYAKTMADYEQASSLLKDIEGSLSLGKKANIDTSVRKLQSIMRNNANTNYGRRANLGKQLQAAGADTLFPELAGQMLSSATPRGIQGATSALGGAAALATNPTLLPGLALTSPRLVGEAAYYAGKAGGSAQKVAEALKSFTVKSPIDPYTLRMLAAKLGQMQPEEQR
jgi:hypothetical protein